jgi:ribonucleoside-diphosphate reductase alpha chain
MACDAVGTSDKSFISVITDFIVKDIELTFGETFLERIVSVEDIQDIVEKNLVKFNQFEVAKGYILYRARREEVREQEHEEYVKKFEAQTLRVTKKNGETERFNIKKIKQTYDRIAHGYEELCPFNDIVEALKDSIVDYINTKDIKKLLIKIMIDLISVQNIHWQVLAGRLIIIDLYKQAAGNRNISIE